MADASENEMSFTTAGAGTVRSDPIDTNGKRDLIFTAELTAVGAVAGDTCDITIQHTNTPKNLLSLTSDAYWETYLTFTQILGNTQYQSAAVSATNPYIQTKTMADAGSNGNYKPIGRFYRFKRVIAGGSASFTGLVRAGHNVQVTT